MATRKLVVELVGDSRSLERAFARSSKASDNFSRGLSRNATTGRKVFIGWGTAIRTAFAAVGVGAVVAAVKQTVDAASGLNEEINKSQVIFGRSSAAIVNWSETTANAIGLSEEAALEAAGNFGAMFRTIGLGDRQAAGMSQRLVKLGADMASFNNQDPSDMLDRLRSGLAGEAEPLRRFGVLLSEARVKQEAYRSGIAKVGAELTEQQKVAARYNLILRDTKLQQDDFARTSESWANVQRRLSALFGDLAAKIGSSLLPQIAALGDRFADWLADPANQQRVIGGITTAIQTLSDAMRTLARIARFLRDEWVEFMDVLDAVTEQITQWALETKATAIRIAQDFVEPFSHIPTGAFDWARRAKAELEGAMFDTKIAMRQIGQDAGDAYGGGFRGALKEHLDQINRGRDTRARGLEGGLITGGAGGTAARRRGLTAEQRNRFFDAMIGRRTDRVQDVRSLQGQITALRAIAALIRARLAITKDITRRLTLEDRLLDVQRQIRGLQEASAQRTKQLREERRQLEIERREREALARQARQFRELGFGPGGEEPVPGTAALRRRLRRVTDAVKGTLLDTDKTRSILAAMRRVLSGGLGRVSREVRDKIEQMLADIDRKLQEHRSRRTRFRAVSADELLAGIGLSPEEMRAARARLARLGPGGRIGRAGPSAFGVPIAGATVVHIHGDVVTPDSEKFIRDMQRRARRTRAQTRGVNPGVALGGG